MAIYPQLHGNIFREPDEEEQMEEKKSDQELEWKRRLEEEKRMELMKNRIQKDSSPALSIERETGQDQGQGEEAQGNANAPRAQSKDLPTGDEPNKSSAPEMEVPTPESRTDTVELTQNKEEANAGDEEEAGEESIPASDAAGKTKGGRAMPSRESVRGAESPSGAAPALAPKAAAQQASAALLKISWLNVITSFGLTLFYIAFHFIGAYVAHMSWFCKFGEEWVPAQASNVISATGAGAKAKKGLEYAELLTFFISIALYLLLIFLIFFILLAPIFAACKLLNTITFGLIC